MLDFVFSSFFFLFLFLFAEFSFSFLFCSFLCCCYTSFILIIIVYISKFKKKKTREKFINYNQKKKKRKKREKTMIINRNKQIKKAIIKKCYFDLKIAATSISFVSVFSFLSWCVRFILTYYIFIPRLPAEYFFFSCKFSVQNWCWIARN